MIKQTKEAITTLGFCMPNIGIYYGPVCKICTGLLGCSITSVLTFFFYLTRLL